MFWTYTHQDFRSRIELKFSYEHAIVMQDYQNLLLTATAVFGKGKSGDSPKGPVGNAENTIVARTNEETVMALQSIGLINGVMG